MLRRRLSTLSNVDCIPVVCFSIFDHTQRACLSALLRIPEILFFSRFSTFSCSSVAIWLMKRDSSSVPMGLCPILLPILLQSYIYFRERRTNKAAERERESVMLCEWEKSNQNPKRRAQPKRMAG